MNEKVLFKPQFSVRILSREKNRFSIEIDGATPKDCFVEIDDPDTGI
jgi:hypothetical protein